MGFNSTFKGLTRDEHLTHHYHHYHHISVMELGHLLTRSGLTYPEVSSKACHDSFCQLGNSVSLPWVIQLMIKNIVLLLILQSFDWLAPFHLELLQAILFIAV